MRKNVGLVAGIATALLIMTVVSSCNDDDSTGPGVARYTANLSAANEVPTNNTTGTGVVTFVDHTTQIEWTMALTGMSAVTQSHIHGPAAVGVNAPVLINLFMPNGPTGTINGTVATGMITNANNAAVSLDSLRTLFNNGNAYVNIHNSSFPAGAIRGQIARSN